MYALVESPVDTEVLQVLSQTAVRVLPVNVMLGMLLSHDMLYTIVDVPVAPVIVGAGMAVLPEPPIVHVAPFAMDDNDLVADHVMVMLGGLIGSIGPDTVL